MDQTKLNRAKREFPPGSSGLRPWAGGSNADLPSSQGRKGVSPKPLGQCLTGRGRLSVLVAMKQTLTRRIRDSGGRAWGCRWAWGAHAAGEVPEWGQSGVKEPCKRSPAEASSHLPGSPAGALFRVEWVLTKRSQAPSNLCQTGLQTGQKGQSSMPERGGCACSQCHVKLQLQLSPVGPGGTGWRCCRHRSRVPGHGAHPGPIGSGGPVGGPREGGCGF